ncbi:reactive intermediate/imine deaminase [Sphingomonas gellani]|uniref:Reactive intermediate/imine deaminase n=1 Tax=Sphingomonas gellani TaxID=1166340 RepID=A0A1H8AYR3_9SPHN|nr:RidA family protein [Sphingomonas gellani]SEM75845.1 reactive intermediate/imine deaminase [Sphingomonas gellani]
MTDGITRYGVEGGSGTGGQHLPFARAVAADGWLYVSGQVAMVNGEVIDGGIVAQSHQAIRNVLAILEEAGYGPEHVVRCGVWLDDARDFQSFNRVFKEYFGAHPPARACVVSPMVVDCKVEVDCVAWKKP